MTDVTASAPVASHQTGGAFYKLVWKWHFLASLYVLPFMAMLAITGGIYLYKPQIEEWLYADRLNVAVGESRTSYEAQIAAVEDRVSMARLRGVQIDGADGRATVIEFNDVNGTRSYAWVDPYTSSILAVQARDDMAMRVVRKFHGELLLGDVGTKFVELAAHWAIVMFITGLFLWWPRGKRTWSKALSPPRAGGDEEPAMVARNPPFHGLSGCDLGDADHRVGPALDGCVGLGPVRHSGSNRHQFTQPALRRRCAELDRLGGNDDPL